MYAFAVSLLISAFWIPECNDTVYPINFILLTGMGVVQGASYLYMYCKDYLIEDPLPPESLNRLHYNEKLFRSQIKVLNHAHIFFSVVLTLLIVAGSLMASHPNYIRSITCNSRGEWKPKTAYGYVF